MGWTERQAKYFKKGNIDRKAELIDEFNSSSEHGTWEVLKCSLQGTVGYMAIKYTDKIDTTKNCVFGLVCLTSVREGRWFGYKDMDETMNPYYYDCPKSILNLLSPTDNEYANLWRAKCLENTTKNLKKELYSAKEGSQIKLTYKCDTRLARKGDVVVFTKRLVGRNYRTNRYTYHWVGNGYRVNTDMILNNETEWVRLIR